LWLILFFDLVRYLRILDPVKLCRHSLPCNTVAKRPSQKTKKNGTASNEQQESTTNIIPFAMSDDSSPDEVLQFGDVPEDAW
jgi:hypothetical protein